MNKKIITIFVFLFLCKIAIAGGGISDSSTSTGTATNKGNTLESEEELKDFSDETGIDASKDNKVIDNGDGTFTIKEGPVNKNGADYGGKNIVVNSDGEIIRADSLDVDGNHFENVQDFQRNSEGEYYVGSAERLQDGNRKLLSGKVITGKDDGLDAQQANSVLDENAVVYMVDGYSSSGDSFNLDNARKVIVDGTYIFRCSFGYAALGHKAPARL